MDYRPEPPVGKRSQATLLAMIACCASAGSALAQPRVALPAPGASTASGAGEVELWSQIRANHPWVRFEPGAWRRTRTTRESFDEGGHVTSRTVAERTERLMSVEPHAYELAVETVVELAGRRTPGAPELNRLSIATDRPTALGVPVFSKLEPASISLGEVMSPCSVWRVEQPTPGGAAVETIWVAEEGFPSIVRRERQAMVDQSPASRQLQTVSAVGAPVTYAGFLVDGWCVETTTSAPSGERSESWAIHSADVPGGIHQVAIVEYGSQGERLRWSVTELIGSGRTPQEDLGSQSSEKEPTIAIEVRPRRLLRLLRGQSEEDKPASP